MSKDLDDCVFVRGFAVSGDNVENISMDQSCVREGTKQFNASQDRYKERESRYEALSKGGKVNAVGKGANISPRDVALLTDNESSPDQED